MKKIFSLILGVVLVVSIFGCKKEEVKQPTEDSLAFKQEYEELNGKTNKSGKEHRTLKISDVNPFVKISPSDLIKKFESEETFYVYFGDPLCPWCRSVLEKAIEVANKKDIEKIYYVKIWDEEGNEILRSKYQLNKKNKPELVTPGTDDYYTIINYLKPLLKDYTLTTSDNKEVNIGEKRIYAPNFVYVEKGEAKTLVTGISSLQSDSRAELTTEMLAEEETIFNDFFTK